MIRPRTYTFDNHLSFLLTPSVKPWSNARAAFSFDHQKRLSAFLKDFIPHVVRVIIWLTHKERNRQAGG